MVRAAFLTMAQLGTYDVIKNNLLVEQMGFVKEKNSTHLLASMITSVVACTAANPPDVIKTRVMNDREGKIGGSGAHFMHVLKNEGPQAFMKGTSKAKRYVSVYICGFWTMVVRSIKILTLRYAARVPRSLFV